MTSNTPRDPLGDARPTATDTNIQTSGSTKSEQVEDRDNVSRVTPEDYPHQDRMDGDTSANRGTHRKEGIGAVTGSGAGAGGRRNASDYHADPQGGGGSAPLPSDKGPNSGSDAPKGGSH
jgi:hypothetical protein